jgi:hypothetical protein
MVNIGSALSVEGNRRGGVSISNGGYLRNRGTVPSLKGTYVIGVPSLKGTYVIGVPSLKGTPY